MHHQTPTQVEAFAVTDKQPLLAYLDAVFARTKSYLSTLSKADLNRVLNEPQYQPLPTVSIRLASAINCNSRDAGQIEYLRGLVKHQGWFPAAEKCRGDHASGPVEGLKQLGNLGKSDNLSLPLSRLDP